MYIDQLIDEIKSNKPVEEIVKKRIAYLTSDEYQNSNHHIYNDSMVSFWEGFIPLSQEVSYNSEASNFKMVPGTEKVYINFVKYLKTLIDKSVDIHHKFPVTYAQNFFEEGGNTNFQEFAEDLVEIGYNRQETRRFLKEALAEYNSAGKYFPNWDKFIEAYYMENSIEPYERYENPEFKKFHDVYTSLASELNYNLPLDLLEGTGSHANMCTEHAMLFQNLSSFLGYPTIMVASILNGELHNYNFVNDADEWVLCDCVNGDNRYRLGKEFSYSDIISTVYGDRELSFLSAEGKEYTYHSLKSLEANNMTEKINQQISEAKEIFPEVIMSSSIKR